MKCSVAGCGKVSKAMGMCSGHYHRLHRYGDAGYVPPPRQISTCSIEGCGSPVGRTGGKGYCQKHYKRFRAHGDPLAGGIDYGSANKFVKEAASRLDVEECILWPYGKNSEGRGRVNIAGKSINADVAVLREARGEKPTPKHECCHSCGNGHLGCVNPSHLYWGTRKENVADAIAHGTSYALNRATGEFSPNSKFSDDLIAVARKRMAAGEAAQAVARDLGIGKTYIYAIRDGLFRNGSRPPIASHKPVAANDNREEMRRAG